MEQFIGHLHVHTEYSPLDGLAKIEDLILRAKELGQTGLAITDHGGSSGLFEAFKLGQKYDFNIVLGQEFYFQNECEDLRTGHIILLAKNEKGLSNIFKLQSLAYDNVYYKPQINLEMLKEHKEGLICTTACIANQIGQYILRNESKLAIKHIMELLAIFKEDFYVELQSSTSEEVIRVNKELCRICKEYSLSPIITNDVHYEREEDYELHEVLLCIQQKSKMSSPKRWKFECNDYWLKSHGEMLEYLKYLDEDFLNSCMQNIAKIFSACKGVTISPGNHLPKTHETQAEEDAELYNLVMEKYFTRIKERGEDNSAFLSDLKKELSVISETGYSGYHLIVAEYANWARENGILVGDGRGSGAGCKVAYTLGITEVNPQKHGLLFERFLSPGREPDYDIDFSDIDAVFKHLQEMYGEKNVARVGAYSSFTCKSAIRKVMGVYGFSQAEIAKIVSYLPKELAFTLEEAMAKSSDLVRFMKENQHIYRAVEKFEGRFEHFSTHAGGVIICENLTSILPVMTNSEDREKLIVALDKRELEALGHYKFDILGLKSLTLMKHITDYTGSIDWHKVDYNDENIYKMLENGDVTGVFQLSEQKDKVMQQQPKNFDDLIAINALIRPGVCDWQEYLSARNNDKDDENTLPFMKSTHGLIVYQDQYLLLANYYAGWEIAYADKHIRKNKDIVSDTDLKEKFLKDGYERGWESNILENIWKNIVEVVRRGYGFNQAHSTSYAMLSFQTAYMKHYHPKEFYAAYLSQNINDSDAMFSILTELKEKEIKVLPPDINKSKDRFLVVEKGILLPLTAIKGVGASVYDEIQRILPINSLSDLLEKRTKRILKNNSISSLIMAGVFDFEEPNRFILLERLFEGSENLANYLYEKQAFGFYLSSTPFDKYSPTPFAQQPNGSVAMTVVEITALSIRYDKNGKEMAFATGINNTDAIKLVFFSSIWNKNPVGEGQLVLIKGRKDGASLLVNTVEVL